MRYTIVLIPAFCLVGCTQAPVPSTKPAAPMIVAPVLSPGQEIVENKDYKNWKQFPIGTTLVFRSVTERGKNQTISTETLRLIRITDQELIVERQNTTEKNDGSLKVINPSEERKYIKSFGLPNGMKAEDFAKPAMKAEMVGEEEVKVLGKAYKTKHYKWNDSAEAGTMNIDYWECDAIPGLMAKQVIYLAKLETTTTNEILSITIPSEKK